MGALDTKWPHICAKGKRTVPTGSAVRAAIHARPTCGSHGPIMTSDVFTRYRSVKCMETKSTLEWCVILSTISFDCRASFVFFFFFRHIVQLMCDSRVRQLHLRSGPKGKWLTLLSGYEQTWRWFNYRNHKPTASNDEAKVTHSRVKNIRTRRLLSFAHPSMLLRVLNIPFTPPPPPRSSLSDFCSLAEQSESRGCVLSLRLLLRNLEQ